jgi:hypothetical protein
MKFLTHSDETIALLLAPPNRTVRPRVTPTLPFTNIDRALSGRQERRTFGQSSRYSFEYTPRFRTVKESTEFRLGLVRLKDEPLAVPLWNDGITMTSPCLAGASSLAKGNTDHPVRYGAEWVAIGANGSHEILVVTNLSANALTLDKPTENAWPAGTMVYPLLFGRFSPRPTLTSVTPRTVTGGLTIVEDSPYARRLNPFASGIATVGPAVPELSAMPFWTLEPNWKDVLDTTEVDIIYRAIGFLRQEQRRVYPQPVVRGLEMEFVCRSRAIIAAVENFFANRRGPVRPFMIPTFRDDLELTQDVNAGDTTLHIAGGNVFSDPAYAETHPGWPFLALVRSAQGGNPPAVEPVRLTEINGGTLTTSVPISDTWDRARTRLCHLMLVCFADAKIEWDYSTPTRAICRRKVVEVPSEYVTPNPDLPEPAYLYWFHQKLPGGAIHTLGLYTSYENAIVYNNSTWTPAPFSHGVIERTLDLTDKTDLTSWGGDFPGNPLRKFLPFTLESDLYLEITEVNANAPDDGSYEILFSGIVREPQMIGDDWKATVDLGRIISGKFPRFQYQRSDNHIQFSEPTQLDRADFKVTATISAKNGFQLDVTGPAQAAQYFAGGELETGAAATYEGRSILHSMPISGGQRFTLDRPVLGAVLGAIVDLYPGYSGSLGDCVARFNNGINFGGFPFFSDLGPQIKAAEQKAASGAKK